MPTACPRALSIRSPHLWHSFSSDSATRMHFKATANMVCYTGLMELNAWTRNLGAVYDKAVIPISRRQSEMTPPTLPTMRKASSLPSGSGPSTFMTIRRTSSLAVNPIGRLSCSSRQPAVITFSSNRKALPIRRKFAPTNCRPSVPRWMASLGCHESSKKPALFWKEHFAMISCTAAAETGTF